MPKTKQKKKPRDSDEETIDRLNNEIRELKSINRSLLRRLKKLDRNYEESVEHDSTDDDKPYMEVFVKKCPSCKSGELSEIIIESLSKKYYKCTGFGCRYRSTTEKL